MVVKDALNEGIYNMRLELSGSEENQTYSEMVKNMKMNLSGEGKVTLRLK